MLQRILNLSVVIALFGAGYLVGRIDGAATANATEPAEVAVPAPQAADRVFELRTYTAPEGRIDDLLARFRDHTLRIFEKHGMTNVGYWTPQDEPLSENTLIYLLAHESRSAGEESWAAFIADPEWQQVAEESQRDGPLITDLDRIWLDPTDFSPME